MELITKTIFNQLINNGTKQQQAQRRGSSIDFKPVVKLFTPDASATWLITEADPDYPDILFGLCDLGLGFPELGGVSLQELMSVKGKAGLPVERDLHFEADKTLSKYTKEALKNGYITA